ncbi:hypothetical protein H0X06_00320 [Candidatus Dependentiae bacterium]|nr:hypothetical protein [Candidatus Dependentiae bacterium]
MSYVQYTNSRPKKNGNGIPLKSKRGPIALTEWGKRWTQTFTESDSTRLSRARSYARSGNVTYLAVHGLQIKAEVLGSRSISYNVSIDIINPYTNTQWNDYLTLLCKKSSYLAHFLEGIMPPAIDDVFKDLNNPLFPLSLESSFFLKCNCYDWAPNCKHVLAVLYIITEMIDEKPLLIFQLRGKSIEKIINELKTLRSTKTSEHPLSSELPLEKSFWQERINIPAPYVVSDSEPIDAYKLLGDAPWKVGTKKITTVLAPLYKHLKKAVTTTITSPEQIKKLENS